MPAELSRTRLRFGVMCSGGHVPAWAAAVVNRVSTSVGAELAILVSDPEIEKHSPASVRVRKALTLKANLWHAFNLGFPLGALPQLRRVAIAQEWPSIPVRVCETTRQGKWTRLFGDADIAHLRGLDLDFILKFGYGIIRGEILTAARHGIWSFHHDDEQIFRGGPPGFWEIARGANVQAAVLQRLTERLDGGVILEKVWVNTDTRSYRRNLARILDASLDMPARAARRVADGLADRVDAPPVTTSAPIYVAPTDGQMLAFLARLAHNFLEYKRRNQLVERWNIGVVRQPIHRFLDPDFTPVIEWAPYSRDGFMIADPFGVPDGDGVRVFCEELSAFTERGWISSLRWSPTRGWSAPHTVLDEGIHMSYPYVVRTADELFVIPECGSRPGLTRYRLAGDRLMADGVMLDGYRLVDTTIFPHDGRWWMLATEAGNEPNARLLAFHATTAHGPWEPHRENPVRTDVRSARPAGTPFHHQGKLYRPAQDCSVTYGWRVRINEITVLTPDHFGETPVTAIGPFAREPYPHGFHTLAACGDVTLVDGKYEEINARVLRYRLGKRIAHGLQRRGAPQR